MRSLLALVLFAPMTASAGGYFYSDSGVVASTRGGAWVASADTRFAQRYNPAALINIDRPVIDLAWNGVQQNVTFDRQDYNGIDYDPVSNEAAPYSVPEFGFATPIGDRWAFAFGLYTPFAPSSDYDPVGPQRYTIISTSILQGNIGPSLAWQAIEDKLTIGVGLQYGFLTVGQRLKANIALSELTLDVADNDIAVDVSVADLFTPSANIGVLVTPVEQLAIGVMFQPPAGYRARGAMEFDATGNAFVGPVIIPPGGPDTEPIWRDDEVGLAMTLPLELRAGVAVMPSDKFVVEAAIHFVNWQSLTELVIEDIDVTIDTSIPVNGETSQTLPREITLPAGFRSATTIALGSEGAIGDSLLIRGGGFYEGSAVPPRALKVGQVDTNKVQLGLGGSILPGDNLRLDLAGNLLFFPTKTVTNSDTQQINALNTENDPTLDAPVGLIVGNGTYSASGWTVGIGASWMFGEKPE